MGLRLIAAAAAALMLLPATAQAADPFGHPCAAQHAVRFCPTADLAQRVPSFDGVPLDVDVTLPATGSGPFPTIVMEHGYPGTKGTFQATSAKGDGGATYHYNDVFYARQGYAVVTLSARGFGRSCGTPASRTAGCERGWTHIADQRFENRDVQTLLGTLVDEGVAKAEALGVTGVSGGGGRAIGLAFLNDRIRLPDGSFAPWVSPAGTPLHIAAAFPRWGWYDLTTALVPNGRPATSARPLGIPKRTWIDLLYAGGAAFGFLAPPGADPQADLTNWRDATKHEPFAPGVSQIAATFTSFIGGAAGLTGHAPAPLLLENGWTDELFPADEALRTAAHAPGAKLLLGDLGHGWAGNSPAIDRRFNDAGASFFAAALKQVATVMPDLELALSQCPKGSAPRVLGGPSLRSLQGGKLVLRAQGTRRFDSRGGSRAIAKAINGAAGNWCKGTPARRERNAATVQSHSPGFTLLGAPVLSARVRTSGSGGQLAARLWVVRGQRQRLISRGLYRLTPNQRGRVRFELHPNAYRVAAGRRIKLEVLGRDAPYAQAQQRRFGVRLSRLRLMLPTRERGMQGLAR